MSSKEAILGALVRPEILALKSKLDFYGENYHIDLGSSDASEWTTKDSLTLEKFLEEHPVPTKPEEMPIYGIAWELVWGIKTPDEIKDARDRVIAKARYLGGLSELETLWVKLIYTDTDMF
jgi:hypothetical protein